MFLLNWTGAVGRFGSGRVGSGLVWCSSSALTPPSWFLFPSYFLPRRGSRRSWSRCWRGSARGATSPTWATASTPTWSPRTWAPSWKQCTGTPNRWWSKSEDGQKKKSICLWWLETVQQLEYLMMRNWNERCRWIGGNKNSPRLFSTAWVVVSLQGKKQKIKHWAVLESETKTSKSLWARTCIGRVFLVNMTGFGLLY